MLQNKLLFTSFITRRLIHVKSNNSINSNKDIVYKSLRSASLATDRVKILDLSHNNSDLKCKDIMGSK